MKLAEFDRDLKLTERRNVIFILCVIGCLVAPIPYYFNFTSNEWTSHIAHLDDVLGISNGWIAATLLPYFVAFISVAVAYSGLRFVFRLKYGKWV